MKRYILYCMGTLENSISNPMTFEEAKSELQKHIQRFMSYDDVEYYEVNEDEMDLTVCGEHGCDGCLLKNLNDIELCRQSRRRKNEGISDN